MMRNDDRGAPPLEHHLDRGTIIGCLGLPCVLALPAILFLPVETWHLPTWALRLVPLVAIGCALVGAILLVRVPSAAPARSQDPLHPLTSRGSAPVQDLPAAFRNRVTLAAAALLLALCVLGYVLVSFGIYPATTLSGTLLTAAAGAALLVSGVLAAAGQLPVPAWRWVRLPIAAGLAPQALPTAAAGALALAWALIVAAGEGYAWAPLGVGALILGGALAGPAARRLASRQSRRDDRQHRAR
jgi:hypothetical protein